MPLLDPPDILPRGMYLVVTCLAQQGPVDRQRLQAMLQPPTLPLHADGTNTFDACLRGLEDLGLVAVDGSTVAVAPDLAVPEDVRAFGEVLLHASCAAGTTTGATADAVADAVADAGTGGGTGAVAVEDVTTAVHHDLFVSLTWWCAQDPYGSPVGWEEAASMLSQHLSPNFGSFPIGNATTWQAFVRWATALGFAEYDGLGSKASSASPVVPDITRAVGAVLQARRWNVPVPAAQAVSSIQEALPMVDGGWLAMALRPEWKLPAERRVVADALDLVLSQALLRGEEEGALTLENRSDADKVLLSDGLVVRPVSHVGTKEGGR